MALKDDLIDLTVKLNELETENGISTANPFHVAALAALRNHADLLGLDDDDLADIEGAGTAARGGGSKSPAPEMGG